MRTDVTPRATEPLRDVGGARTGDPHGTPTTDRPSRLRGRWPVAAAAIVIVVLAVVLGVLTLGGDSDSEGRAPGTTATEPESETAPAPTDDPATTDAATPPPTAAPGPTTGASVLEDGRHPVFLTALDVDARTVEFDLVQWLTGDAARDAWTAEHPDMPGDPPNDYFIVNDNPRLRVLPVVDGVPVTVLDHGWDPMDITFEELPGFMADDLFPEDGFLWHSPFWLTVSDGMVTDVDEQYIP